MADSIKTEIRKAIVSSLQSISILSGYKSNLSEVNYEPKSFEQLLNFPAANFFWGKEDYLINDHSSGYIFKRCHILLDFYLENHNDIDIQRSKILDDVEKNLFNNYNLSKKCNILMIDKNYSWGIESAKNHGGHSIDITINYSQNILDPSLPTAAIMPKLPIEE